MKITDFLKGRFEYIQEDQDIWITDSDGSQQKVLDVRGWGAIQHLFPMTKEGQDEAGKFQDEIGEWIAKALNEKLENNKP